MPTSPHEQQRAPAEAVDVGHGDERGQHVDPADRPGGGRRLVGRGGEPGRGEDLVGVVDDGVDPGDLLEHRQPDADHQRLAERLARTPRSTMARSRVLRPGGRFDRVERRRRRRRRVGPWPGRRPPPRGARPSSSHRGDVRHRHHGDEQQHAGHGGDAEHQPPVVAVGERLVDEVGDEDADGDGELVGRDEAAAQVGWVPARRRRAERPPRPRRRRTRR